MYWHFIKQWNKNKINLYVCLWSLLSRSSLGKKSQIMISNNEGMAVKWSLTTYTGESCFQSQPPAVFSVEALPWIEAKSLYKQNTIKYTNWVTRDSVHVAAPTCFCPRHRQHFRIWMQPPRTNHSKHINRSLQHTYINDRERCSGASTWQTDHTTPAIEKLYQSFQGRSVLRVCDQDVCCEWKAAGIWLELVE